MTSISTPRKPLMIASEAEQVLLVVSTKTRCLGSSKVGKAEPAGDAFSVVVVRKGSGLTAPPVTGFTPGFLLLNSSELKVLPLTPAPATMYEI